jgi:hypothetical protein
MTWILTVATFGVLTILGVSCRRAVLDLEDQLCECLHTAEPPGLPAAPVLTRIEGGREAACTPAGHGRQRHLRVVGAR